MNSQSLQTSPSDKLRIRLLWAGFAFLYLALILLVRRAPSITDEAVHFGQINLFDHGIFAVGGKYFAMLPGYHILAAGLLWATDLRSFEAARVLNALFGLLTIGAFHLLRKRIWPADSALATLQFALLPILLPYDFLVYTDALSLGLVLAAGAATLRKQHVISGLLMVAAMGVRQTNVIWLPLFAGIALWPPAPAKWPAPRQVMACVWPYAVGVALFVAYWIWNGHISLSNEQAKLHPDWSLHIGNIYFLLFMCALFFPLHVVSGLGAFAANLATRPWLTLLPLSAFALYWEFFRVDHPYNLLTGTLILHNYVLQQCQANPVYKAAFGIIGIAAACGLWQTKLRPDGAVLLYPLTAFALAASWMVEPRYSLIPLALWLAFRERRDQRTEDITTALWAVIAVCLCLGLFSRLLDL